MARFKKGTTAGMAVVMLLPFSVATEMAWAQAGTLGNIMGKATDETGGVLPGVTVAATSPALQVPSVTTVTDAEGSYHLRDLPAPGMYRVVFELQGFQTIAFEGVSLTAGFTARLDPAMKVSTVSETVEVSGQSPVVDTVSVAGVSSIQRERIESVPLGLGIQNLLPMAAGVSLQGSPDVGDSQLANRQRIVTYGVALTPTLEFEGINSTTAHQGNTALYLDFYQVEEASFKTTGNNADVAFGGVHQQMIMKSGGNIFHGSVEGDYENKRWQSNNVSNDLAAKGFSITNPTTRYYDVNGDLGGYIFKDTLWFYGGASKQEIDQLQIGFVAGPNAAGCWTCADAPPGTDKTNYIPQPGVAVAGNPASQEITNNVLTGPLGAIPGTIADRWQARTSVSYVARNHQLKIGTDLNWERQDSTRPNEYPSGSYTLLFNRGVPTEIRTYNTPTIPIDRLFSQAAFVTDTWSRGRVTLSYGVRWERYHNFYPDQTKAAGQFSSEQRFQGADVLTWTDVVPRAGLNWDVTGDGKTSLKTFFGIFGDTMGADFAATYNPNAEVTTRYRWSGPCKVTQFTNVSYTSPNTSCDYVPGTVDFSPTGRDYISASGGSNTLPNPELKQNKNYEASVRLDRQLVANTGIGFAYVHHRHTNWYDTGGVNVGRPYEIWNVPIVLTDPFDRQAVTVYTYPASYAGAAFNQNKVLNAPGDRPDYYHSFEMTLNKRFSRKWNMSSSFWITKNHQWIRATPTSPNDDRFAIDDTWAWEARTDANYRLPWDVNTSFNLRAASGAKGQRTQTFSDSRLLQGTVTLRMEEFGAQHGRTVPVTSFRLAKKFRAAERYAVDLNFSVFNLINSSAPVSISYLSGTFGRITDILAPRVARLGLQFSF